MKTITIQSLIAACFLLMTSVGGYAQISKVDIMATGLTCSMCSNAINKQLKSLSQISNVATDLNTNTFTISFNDHQMVNPKVLKDAVEKAGFFVGSMILTLDPKELAVEHDKTSIGDASYVFMDQKKTKSTQYRVVDKGFVTQKEYKKLSKAYAKHESYSSDNDEVYHIVAL
ncbi:heavy-metal-associated domain-containing protein [Sphingobacterium faecale]|uniref:Heavy-metal-associated domain-containing protein n=1 Tax=Sphingobacterium faecale TaxID=2803775 RepID=A0ABS1R827_9SPHI|nr:heavy metal-associated domain-containing protein [Sphingobacterium faecale]MBL1410455.1 heavy-metal-associated domain-containing protein [Sphingobacterium faecale]